MILCGCAGGLSKVEKSRWRSDTKQAVAPEDWTPSVSNRVWGSGESSGDVLANALYLDAGHRRKGAAVFLIDVVNRANVELIKRWATRASREKWFFASASCRADHAFNKGRQ